MAGSNFNRAFEELIGTEGGYSNHPRDPGKETMWGITIAVARANGYHGAMRDMPIETAKAIYAKNYWQPNYDKLPYSLAFQVFDGAVNSGEEQAARWLQDACGVKVDGDFGPISLAAALASDSRALVLRFNANRLHFMTGLSTWPDFGKGWARRIAKNLMLGAE